MSFIIAIVAIVIAFIIGAVIFVKTRNVSLPAQFNAINNYIKSGNPRGAVRLCKNIIAKNPENYDAHYFMGLAYLNLNQDELALEELKTFDKAGVTSKNISEYELRTHLAELYVKFNKIDEALKEYALLAQKKTNEYEVYFKMGELFDSKGNKQQAAAYYMKTLQLKKKYVPALYNLGKIYFDFKKYIDAKKIFSILKSEESGNLKAYYYLGVIDKNEGNYNSAIANLEKATRDKELKVKALAERGLVYSAMGKNELAVIEFERALNNINGESQNFILNIRYFLADTYETLRDINNAVKQWQLIQAVKPGFKNIDEKLSLYQDSTMDDSMKDFMTAANDDFLEICQNIAIAKEHNVEEIRSVNNGEYIEMLVSENNNGWINLKKKLKIMRVYRNSDPLDERQIREISDFIKTKEYFKAFIISAVGFTERAIAFAQERPLELIGKNELQKILKNISV